MKRFCQIVIMMIVMMLNVSRCYLLHVCLLNVTNCWDSVGSWKQCDDDDVLILRLCYSTESLKCCSQCSRLAAAFCRRFFLFVLLAAITLLVVVCLRISFFGHPASHQPANQPTFLTNLQSIHPLMFLSVVGRVGRLVGWLAGWMFGFLLF